jgi:hypothetical protein
MLAVNQTMPIDIFAPFSPVCIVNEFKSFLNDSVSKRVAVKEAQKRYEVSHRLTALVCDMLELDKAKTVSSDVLSDYLLQVDDAIDVIKSMQDFSSPKMRNIFDNTLSDLLTIQFKISNILADRLLADN